MRRFLLPLTLLVAVPAFAQTPTLTVRADRPGTPVSPRLFGLFFEEINHAGDGGLYAERVRNRDFEEAPGRDGALPGWSVRGADAARDDTHPLAAANPQALRLSATGDTVSATNEGYWGIALTRGASYRLRLFARRDRRLAAPVIATLHRRDGALLAKATLGRPGENWTALSTSLTPNRDEPDARLTLSVAGPGTLWLDGVSLFPAATFRRRENGLRADLAEKLAALKPSFLRFPGGCYVEGERIVNCFSWKASLGPPHARPGHLNDVWGYRSTDGLGFHEYLLLCEDLGAEPLFVVNCGMSHRDVVPMEKLGPWVQDALDALEYANGPAASRWGALRAKHGHPRPFGLRLLEIGNENAGPAYAERYKAFRDAIKARWPEVRLIANVPVPHPMEVIDEHYYASPDWFWSQADRYDRTPRNGTTVYVGEYAVTQGAGEGNLRAALAEAAFMTGLERNGDLVEMASYAPLFVHVRDRRWNPNAIVFDGARSFGTPSYHVQHLFAAHRIVAALPVEVPPTARPRTARGTVGVGTWQTQAEFKDLTVTVDGKTIAPGGKGDWRVFSGDWDLDGETIRQSAPGPDRRATLTLPVLAGASNYTVRLQARKLGGAEGFLVLVRASGDGDYTWWNLGGWGNREHGIEKAVGGSKTPLGPHVAGRIETGRWYAIRIETEGPRIRCWLDNALIHDVVDRSPPTLAASAGRAADGMLIVKVVNGAEEAIAATLDLPGAGALRPDGEAIVLTSASMDDENRLDAPERVAPRARRLDGVSARFSHTFPPRSLTILRLKPRRP